MKKLKSLKLSQISKTEMEKKEMHNLLGGCGGGNTICWCACLYSGSGGSSTYMNYNANSTTGIHPSYM